MMNRLEMCEKMIKFLKAYYGMEERDKKVLQMYYEEESTDEFIGVCFKISRERVRQIRTRALHRLAGRMDV